MDYVYVCKSGENEELRYSIRSLVKNAPPGKIWVVGGKPEWYVGNFIETSDVGSKYSVVRNSLKTIARSLDISEEFILMNDDFYIINPITEVKTFHGGSLKDKIDIYDKMMASPRYTDLLQSTLEWLQRHTGTEDAIDYELHIPLKMNKKGLAVALRSLGLWRSTFGNIYNIGGIETNDVKVYSDGIMDLKNYDINNLSSDYLSSEDDTFEIVYEKVLKNRFPEPSPYEIIY